MFQKECKLLQKQNNTESIPGWEGIPEAVVLNALIATVCCSQICAFEVLTPCACCADVFDLSQCSSCTILSPETI